MRLTEKQFIREMKAQGFNAEEIRVAHMANEKGWGLCRAENKGKGTTGFQIRREIDETEKSVARNVAVFGGTYQPKTLDECEAFLTGKELPKAKVVFGKERTAKELPKR